MTEKFAFPSYDIHRGIAVLGSLWKLHRGARTVACVLKTHPLGWELVTMLGEEPAHTQIANEPFHVMEVSEDWRAAWEARGWTAA